MKILVRLSLLTGLVLSLGLSLSDASGLPSTPGSMEPATAKPTILKVEPEVATPWSYIMITGENLMSADGSCSVEVSEVLSYVASCSRREIRAVVPWTAQTGTVLVSTEGAASNPFPIEISPLELDSGDIVAGEIHLQVRPDVDIGSVISREGDSPLSVKPLGDPDSPYMQDWYRLKVSPGSEVAEAIAYSQDAEVLYAAPVSIPVPADVPNDERYSDQWGLPKIGAPTAWSHSKGSGIKIAIIDSGFDTGHEDLAAHMTAGWNCNGGRDVSPLSGHGTHVAGIAAAVTNNGQGVAGVGWNSSILPLRLDNLGGQSCPWDEVHGWEGFLIDKAMQEGADVVNMSYTYPGPMPQVCGATRRAWEAGLVLVGAAGNESSPAPRDPAACDYVMAVGATNPDDSKASYTNYGSWITLSAPGSGILSTFPNNHYEWLSGTSMAAPLVAGTAALLMSQGLDNCDAEKSMVENADPISWPGGAGRLDAGAALTNPAYCLDVPIMPGDYDGDGKTDYAVWRPSNGWWYVRQQAYVNWGVAGDIPVPGDYNGDGKTDYAVWRPSNGMWYVRQQPYYQWGQPGDIPVPADYNGDGKTDIAIWRPGNVPGEPSNHGFWYVYGQPPVQWGLTGDIPAPADYILDAKADMTVWRPANADVPGYPSNYGFWYVREGPRVQWGLTGDIPAPADYIGDTKADITVWRPINTSIPGYPGNYGFWYVRAGPRVQWGLAGDVPVAGHYISDTKADITVWRPINTCVPGDPSYYACWYVRAGPRVQWGVTGDIPLAGYHRQE